MATRSPDDGKVRTDLYTNALRGFGSAPNVPYLSLNLDSWYYSEWADPDHAAMLGTLELGIGPLTVAQGASDFIARQVAAFQGAFADLFRPTTVEVWYKPKLTAPMKNAFHFAAPKSPTEVQAMQSQLEHSSYDGITSLWITFDVRTVVRDWDGELRPTWLPAAGQLWCNATYASGMEHEGPGTGAARYRLTPLAQAGMAVWTATLRCSVISLFRRSNAGALTYARAEWQSWLQAHPQTNTSVGDEQAEDDAHAETPYAYIVTLAEPPPGTPADNQMLHDLNTPRLREAVSRWEQALGQSLQWGVDLEE